MPSYFPSIVATYPLCRRASTLRIMSSCLTQVVEVKICSEHKGKRIERRRRYQKTSMLVVQIHAVGVTRISEHHGLLVLAIPSLDCICNFESKIKRGRKETREVGAGVQTKKIDPAVIAKYLPRNASEYRVSSRLRLNRKAYCAISTSAICSRLRGRRYNRDQYSILVCVQMQREGEVMEGEPAALERTTNTGDPGSDALVLTRKTVAASEFIAGINSVLVMRIGTQSTISYVYATTRLIFLSLGRTVVVTLGDLRHG
ncbi:hypothetical protein ARMSODRAFT_63940 [Armillaria solidipes]|uniref:Uncharacterized protein n=1 Tax=Armillaria solidipes TaxID=1076256 RepID=A0A2H3C4Q9_9AGAR|nr:hypothetical protein ARMSODRAFT_63940 [Armillaria solidipes]